MKKPGSQQTMSLQPTLSSVKNAFLVRLKGKWWLALALVAVYGLLGLYILRQWKTIISFNWQIKPFYLLAMAIFHLLGLLTMFIVWYLMMHKLARGETINLRGAQDAPNATRSADHRYTDFLVDLRIYSFSILARHIPLPIWSIGSRVVLYQKEHIRPSLALTASGLEIILTCLVSAIWYGLLLPFTMPFSDALSRQATLAILTITIVCALALLLRPNLMIELMNSLLRLLKRESIPANIQRNDLLLYCLIYTPTAFLEGLALYFAVAALIPQPPPVLSAISFSLLSGLVSTLTIALPAGMGLKEITIASLLGKWAPMSAGLVFSFVYRILQTLVETIWVIIAQYLPDRQPPPPG